MKKAILISIKPKWVAKILSGEKTIEIRKSIPNCDLPIDVYIYCTKDKNMKLVPYGLCSYYYVDKRKVGELANKNLNGKVVAKFTLNKAEDIYSIEDPNYPPYDICDDYVHRTNSLNNKQLIKQSQLSEQDIFDYLEEDEKAGYAWYIDNLVIFDKPEEIKHSKLFKPITTTINGGYAPKHEITSYVTFDKPPQGWCYIEVPNDK